MDGIALMQFSLGVIAGLIIGVLLTLVGMGRFDNREPRHNLARKKGTAAVKATDRLTDPPMLTTPYGERVSLGEFLRKTPRRSGNDAWEWVVSEFYTRAAGDVRIAPYFANVDIEVLQRHFLATIKMVCSDGLTVGAIRAMDDRHTAVRDLAGNRITPEVYDLTVSVLGQVIGEQLRRDGVEPGPVIDQLLVTVAPLRAAIAPAEEAV